MSFLGEDGPSDSSPDAWHPPILAPEDSPSSTVPPPVLQNDAFARSPLGWMAAEDARQPWLPPVARDTAQDSAIEREE
jgi:hypothetical protein